MRKMRTILVCLSFLLLFSGYAFATDNETTGLNSIILTDGTNELTLNFSPGVIGQYIGDDGGTPGNIQWFAICTYHEGGEKFYGSTSEETSMYKKDRATTDKLAAAAIPTNPADAVAEASEGDDGNVTYSGGWTGWEK